MYEDNLSSRRVKKDAREHETTDTDTNTRFKQCRPCVALYCSLFHEQNKITEQVPLETADLRGGLFIYL